MIPIVIGALGTVTQKLIKGLEDLESGVHSDNSIKIGQNTEKSPRNLRRFAVTQTSVEDQQLT